MLLPFKFLTQLKPDQPTNFISLMVFIFLFDCRWVTARSVVCHPGHVRVTARINHDVIVMYMLRVMTSAIIVDFSWKHFKNMSIIRIRKFLSRTRATRAYDRLRSFDRYMSHCHTDRQSIANLDSLGKSTSDGLWVEKAKYEHKLKYELNRILEILGTIYEDDYDSHKRRAKTHFLRDDLAVLRSTNQLGGSYSFMPRINNQAVTRRHV